MGCMCCAVPCLCCVCAAYCVLYAQVGTKVKQSSTIKQTLNPMWNEPLHITLDRGEEQLASGLLGITIFDADEGSKDDELCSTTVTLKDLVLGDGPVPSPVALREELS